MAEAHLDDVYRYVLYLTGDRNVAEDLTNATFERALHRWSRFDPKRGSAKTWLCQLARGAALDHFRAEQRRRKREETYAATTREGGGSGVRRRPLPRARPSHVGALRRRARSRGASRRARAGRRPGRGRARHQPDRVLDPTFTRVDQVGRKGGIRCLSVISTTHASRRSSVSCARRRRPRPTGCASGWVRRPARKAHGRSGGRWNLGLRRGLALAAACTVAVGVGAALVNGLAGSGEPRARRAGEAPRHAAQTPDLGPTPERRADRAAL